MKPHETPWKYNQVWKYETLHGLKVVVSDEYIVKFMYTVCCYVTTEPTSTIWHTLKWMQSHESADARALKRVLVNDANPPKRQPRRQPLNFYLFFKLVNDANPYVCLIWRQFPLMDFFDNIFSPRKFQFGHCTLYHLLTNFYLEFPKQIYHFFQNITDIWILWNYI